jgi:S-adenosylmethionine:diacylglycerol 3-amino-3-carboxypropyl transferase
VQNSLQKPAHISARAGSASRLKAAVQGRDGNALERVLDRLFTFAFKGLVYPQIWEDPDIDLDALALRPDSRMVTIASSGCNVLSYLIAGPCYAAMPGPAPCCACGPTRRCRTRPA